MTPAGKKRVLIVDDEPDMVDILLLTLESEGYDVLVARDGLQGLEVAARDKPDLILMDVNMPEMDGFQASLRLKKNPATRSIPVILLTARSGEGDRMMGTQTGARMFVTKPFDKQDLLAKIKESLESRTQID